MKNLPEREQVRASNAATVKDEIAKSEKKQWSQEFPVRIT